MADKRKRQRLLKLADFLEKLPRGKFDLDVIGRAKLEQDSPAIEACGTAACAIGWTPRVFPRLCKYGECSPNEKYNVDTYTYEVDGYYITVEGKGELSNLEDFELARELFDLDYDEADYLFMPDSYPHGRRGKMSVAKRLRKFVAEGKIPGTEVEDEEESYC